MMMCDSGVVYLWYSNLLCIFW